MKKSEKYLKVVEWSAEDGCFIGRCPELMLGGVHGADERKVFAELCDAIEEWVAIAKEDEEPLPPGMAGKRFSGKFNLRLRESLHQRLVFESAKVGKSLNAFCAEALEDAVTRR